MRAKVYPLAFLQDGAILDIYIKQVDFLVPLGDLTQFIYPEDRVLHPLGVEARLVDADMDRESLAASVFSQALNKFALMHRLDKPDGFLSGTGDVIARLGEKQRLPSRVSDEGSPPRAWVSWLTFAPTWTAFFTRRRHCARLWAILAVDVNWPTAYCSMKII